MTRQFYLDLAASGARFPIGTDLVLRRHENAEAILRDGARLADIILDAARAYGSPLAFPVMDLGVEKAYELASATISASFAHAEGQLGMEAFVEKRPPPGKKP